MTHEESDTLSYMQVRYSECVSVPVSCCAGLRDAIALISSIIVNTWCSGVGSEEAKQLFSY